MRLCFVSTMDGAPWGASEELWSKAAMRFRAEGHDVSASVIWWPTLSPRILALRNHGVRLVFERRPYDLRERVRHELVRRQWIGDYRSRWLRRQQPDVVVISQGGSRDGLDWMERCCTLQIPFVAKLSCNAEAWWPTDELAERMLTAYRSARTVMCVSRRNLKMLEAQLGERLPNAVVGWDLYSVPHSKPVPWPPQDGVWRLACVARLEPSAKGQDLLLEVLSRPAWRDRPLQVGLFGLGPCERTLRRVAAAYGLTTVRFEGHVNDVRETIWAGHHLLVLPSRFEGLPLALIEAMLCARASVATEAAGGGDLCLDRETGFVVPAPSAIALNDALERAWRERERWHDLGQAAYAVANGRVSKDPLEDFRRMILNAAQNP